MNMQLLQLIQPYENESMISYLFRLSEKNSCPLSWLLQEYKLSSIRPHAKINCITNINILTRIKAFTQLYGDSVDRLTLNWILSSLDNDGKEISIWKLHEFANDETLFCCPKCIKEYGYHNLLWQLKPINICLKHGLYLVNKCPKCKSNLRISDIIYGKCLCGAKIESREIGNKGSNFYQHQKNIYYCFNINDDKTDDALSLPLGLKKMEYLVLAKYLYKIIKNNYKILATFREACEITSKPESSFEVYNLVANLIYNWPEYMLLLFNDLRNFLDENQDSKLYEPLSAIITFGDLFILLDLYFEGITVKELIRPIFSNYVISTFGVDHFKRRVGHILKNNKYIPAQQAYLLFNNEHNLLDELFSQYNIENELYFNFDEVLQYFSSIVKKSYSINEKSISYLNAFQAHNLFNKFDVSIGEVFNCIKESEVEVFIDFCNKYSCLENIFMKEKDIKIMLLQFLLNKISKNEL